MERQSRQVFPLLLMGQLIWASVSPFMDSVVLVIWPCDCILKCVAPRDVIQTHSLTFLSLGASSFKSLFAEFLCMLFSDIPNLINEF